MEIHTTLHQDTGCQVPPEDKRTLQIEPFKAGWCFKFNFWLFWVFMATRRLSLISASGGCSSSVCELLTAAASLVAERRLEALRLLRCTGLEALQQVASSWSKDWTCVPCIGSWILNHWTTRDVLSRVNFVKRGSRETPPSSAATWAVISSRSKGLGKEEVTTTQRDMVLVTGNVEEGHTDACYDRRNLGNVMPNERSQTKGH